MDVWGIRVLCSIFFKKLFIMNYVLKHKIPYYISTNSVVLCTLYKYSLSITSFLHFLV